MGISIDNIFPKRGGSFFQKSYKSLASINLLSISFHTVMVVFDEKPYETP
jgi:hypothetical protein